MIRAVFCLILSSSLLSAGSLRYADEVRQVDDGYVRSVMQMRLPDGLVLDSKDHPSRVFVEIERDVPEEGERLCRKSLYLLDEVYREYPRRHSPELKKQLEYLYLSSMISSANRGNPRAWQELISFFENGDLFFSKNPGRVMWFREHLPEVKREWSSSQSSSSSDEDEASLSAPVSRKSFSLFSGLFNKRAQTSDYNPLKQKTD